MQRPDVVAQQEGKRDTWRQRLVELRPVVSYSTFAYLCEFYSDTESESLATLQILLKKLLSIGGSYLSEEIRVELAEFDGNELDSGDRPSG